MFNEVSQDIDTHYINKIIDISMPYLEKVFSKGRLDEFLKEVSYLKEEQEIKKIIEKFTESYIRFVKEDYQRTYQSTNEKLISFIEKKNDVKIIWGDCLEVLKGMKSESIHLMVTSPPYYNAREYSQWRNLNDYLDDMRKVIKEAYRVLDNHRVFVFNVGDIFDNDNITTQSVWGSRRIPLSAYFIKIFEEEGFTFVDDFIWDKGEVQSERHKNKPYPFYQYPMNCYEHILIFHKHRLDNTRYPCPVCGTLKVNGNTQSEIGLRSWECKNSECFERSESNRGKRFSLKTIMTQGRQKEENILPEDFIKKWRRDIIKFPPVIKINSKGENILGHTAPFPEDIPEFAIRMFSYKGEYVLDPFAGSFTSVIVAKKLERIGIGIEINKEMFRKAGIENIKKNIGENLFSNDNIEIDELDYE
ncbi:MAG TPA: site-specific DNA-methyltransferase [Candidatus Kapabacteria bacterium]|nr:site-specific DNA-methyltransferase [Candidatus Kapabacteria bacterium]